MKLVRVAALLAALTLILAACTDNDPEPTLDPTPSTSTTSPISPTPSTTPALPTGIDAVRDWVSERNRALNTGDTAALRELTADDCASCEPYIDLIEDVYTAGGKYETTGWTVDRIRKVKSTEVTAAITMHGGVMIAAAGEPADEYEQDKAIFRFRVKPGGDGLVVSFIGLLQ